MKVEVTEEKRNEMLNAMNLDPNREVGVSLSVGEHEIKAIHTDAQPYRIPDGKGGFKTGTWYPVEFTDGARVSIKTILRSRGLKWNSRKVGDRFDALLANGTGMTLNLLDVHEEQFTDKDGNAFDGKVYTYAPTLIG